MAIVGSQALLAAACAFVGVVNFFVLSQLLPRFSAPVLVPRNRHYDYTGSDYPPYLISPVDMPRVALDVEESVHHGVGDAALSDWEDTVSGTFGWYKIGPAHHEYSPTMYHEQHCLRMLNRALIPESIVDKTSNGHAQHCLNYLRQMTLCYPDRTLEPPDVLSRAWDVNRAGGSTHVCRDWSLVLREGRRLRAEWLEFIAQHWDRGDVD